MELSWQEGSDKVELFWSTKPTALQYGETLPYNQTGGIGTPIPVHQKGMASTRLPGHGVYYFLPVTVKGQLAIIGKTASVAHAEEVSDLSGKMDDGSLRLTWKYPAGAQQVEVICFDKYASKSGNPISVSLQEYQRAGFWSPAFLPQNSPDVTVRVRTVIVVPGDIPSYSLGREIDIKVKKTNLRFSVQKNGLASIFSSTRKFDLRV
ncbi:MAG: hypothetical protein IPN76_21995 [Saprospiraceae bacterium]|nr:hypothetical protein [Saprospiraceae bacterium]